MNEVWELAALASLPVVDFADTLSLSSTRGGVEGVCECETRVSAGDGVGKQDDVLGEDNDDDGFSEPPAHLSRSISLLSGVSRLPCSPPNML